MGCISTQSIRWQNPVRIHLSRREHGCLIWKDGLLNRWMRERERKDSIHTYNSYHGELCIEFFIFQIRCFQMAIGQYRDKTIFTITGFQCNELSTARYLMHTKVDFRIILRARWLKKTEPYRSGRLMMIDIRVRGCSDVCHRMLNSCNYSGSVVDPFRLLPR
jgi:hypothetical protein